MSESECRGAERIVEIDIT